MMRSVVAAGLLAGAGAARFLGVGSDISNDGADVPTMRSHAPRCVDDYVVAFSVKYTNICNHLFYRLTG